MSYIPSPGEICLIHESSRDYLLLVLGKGDDDSPLSPTYHVVSFFRSSDYQEGNVRATSVIGKLFSNEKLPYLPSLMKEMVARNSLSPIRDIGIPINDMPASDTFPGPFFPLPPDHELPHELKKWLPYLRPPFKPNDFSVSLPSTFL